MKLGTNLHACKDSVFASIAYIKNKIAQTVFFVFLIVLSFIFAFPILFTVTNSFMSEQEICENYAVSATNDNRNKAQRNYALKKDFINMKLIPDEVTIKQYYTVLIKKNQYIFMFWNSIRIVLPIVIGQIIIASMAAYVFSMFKFKLREPLFFIYIIVMLMPYQVTLVPNYIVAEKLGLIGSYLSIILPNIFNAFGVFLLRQYMVFIPYTYIEAGKMDGASHLYIFTRIVLPMCKAGVAALAILTFMDNWNMVEQPLVFIRDAIKQPLSIYLYRINEGEIGISFAASAFYMLPMLLVFLYGENYLIEGIQLSGIKG